MAQPPGPSGLTTRDRRRGLARLPEGTAPALRKLEAAMGGRAALIAALALAPLDDDTRYVLGLIADPRHDAEDLGVLCAMGGITPGHLLQLYKSAVVARAQVEAIHEVAEGLPAVAADVMARAVPHYVTCADCRGTGTVTPEPTRKIPNPTAGPCPTCVGTGTIVRDPDLDTQKVALELGGVYNQKGGGLHLTLAQQTVLPGATPTSFTQLQTAVDAVLTGEIVPEAPDPPDASPPTP